MNRSVELSNEIYSRLENLAVGFDSPSNVIKRLLDYFENNCSYVGLYTPKLDSEKRIFTNSEIQEKICNVAKVLPTEELEKLCNDKISKSMFGISFPLFVRVSTQENESVKREAVQTKDGVSRWTWKYSFDKDGYEYAICTQWYKKNDPYVLKWLNKHEN